MATNSDGTAVSTTTTPPIVYTIAGSDSGGGAGIQADLLAMNKMGCHGCSAITCLTAQNSVGVTAVHTPEGSFLREQLDALGTDLPPMAVKLGMLPNEDVVLTVASFLRQLKQDKEHKAGESETARKVWIVLDPVMISTSGHRLIDDNALSAIREHLFPLVDLLTPNKFEAEALLGRKLTTSEDVERAAADMLATLSVGAVLVKGGHSLAENGDNRDEFALDYFLSRSQENSDNEPRLCDGDRGVWLRTPRYDTIHTHGTGCTLSSAIASALARGEQQRVWKHNGHQEQEKAVRGAMTSIGMVDACCLAKAYVTAGISHAVQLGQGPGPVRQTSFPESYEHFPSILTMTPEHDVNEHALPLQSSQAAIQQQQQEQQADRQGGLAKLGHILPIVNSVEWVERLCKVAGITDIQLRIKNVVPEAGETILEAIRSSQGHCHAAGVRLWVNDYWEQAIQAGCFGVHLGQEDLCKCVATGGLDKLKRHGKALGISTHSYGELAVALGCKPSYISLGPVFATGSKQVAFDPQGIETVREWRRLIPPTVPLVAIGGISTAKQAYVLRRAGADCVAVIGAVTTANDVPAAVADLCAAMK